uniref:Phospholipid-transporting ATPase n=2 Tax=Rhodosorus marinus TaxID=101924 RepID=A0A7S3A2G3_9RHOD|mmetsp:Transcript_42444/g.165694  ORF Transcript_42444/g.165694 Transcript_42444/m.165694 type:complete len:1120 (+) Transcript_42444:151-3510(+)
MGDEDGDFAQVFGGDAGAKTLKSDTAIQATKKELNRKDQAPETRVVEFNNEPANTGFVTNIIKSTKYTWWNVVPKSLWEQFRKVANFYFLIVAILTFLPGVTSFSPSTAVIPLVLVVGFSIARELYDDGMRGRSDRRSNHQKFSVLKRDAKGSGMTEEVKSLNIKVGDILVLKKNSPVPADCLALLSTEEGGVLYVSTAQLDGETNLKRHLVTQATKDLTDAAQVHALDGKAEVSGPNPQFEVFQGSVKLAGAEDAVPVDSLNLILRGSTLRNTEEVHALVVYTGVDSKVALNMRDPPSKMCQLDRTLNWTVLMIFLLLVILVIVFAALAGVAQERVVQESWYLGPTSTDSGVAVGFRSVATFIVLFSAWIPISLFVSLESVRVFQALFMFRDEKMKSYDGRRMAASSTNLSDTLGIVHTILSDKTGTLTRNVMEYVACAFSGEIIDIREDPSLMKDRLAAGEEKVNDMASAMAICHSVVPDFHGEEEGEILEHPTYQGQSPDEVSLVESARSFGLELMERSVDKMVLVRNGEKETYEMVGEIEFNSDRKRMSLVVKLEDGNYRVYTKGADTTMFPRILISSEEEKGIEDDLHAFAVEGLRTLVFASKDITEEQYQSWQTLWREALLSTDGREEKVAAAAEVVESDMKFIGVTAVEDKLQDQVPETIEFLRNAGISLWVLTGDKRETAENIGYSAAMLSRSMTVVHMEAHSQEEVSGMLEDTYRTHCDSAGFEGTVGNMKSLQSLTNVKQAKKYKSAVHDGDKSLAVIIDGKTLQFVLDSYAKYFLAITDHCKTVICCRVTPMQKALVVRMVKKLRGCVTLAIGDGGNDVSMIQEADVGVGLYGKEGTQASRSADFAIGEFKLLKRLLCIHGHYCWVRNPGLINVSFYKNVFITMGQVFYQFFCQFSGTSIHNEYIVTVFNVVITLFNPIFFALFEKDLDEEVLMEKPEMYQANRERKNFGKRTVFEWVMGYALWHSIVTFWGQYGSLGSVRESNWLDGYEGGINAWGFGLSTQVVIIVLVKMLLMARTWNGLYLASFAISLAVYFVIIPIIIAFIDDNSLNGVLLTTFSSGTWWITFIVNATAAFMLDFIVVLIRRFYFPDAITMEQEREYKRYWTRK